MAATSGGEPPISEPGDLTLRLTRVGASAGDDPGSFRVLLETTRGEIRGILHPVEGGAAAVVAVSGALGGLDGPAGGLYRRLAVPLAVRGVSLLRLDYRHANAFDECVLDVLAGCSFLRGLGALDLALVGHSFGGAVVIRAGELSAAVRGVVSLSPQVFGTASVHQLAKPLLLVHGTGDTILSYAASEDIYSRARDPRQIVLFQEAGHLLMEAGDRLDDILCAWLTDCLAGKPVVSGREEIAYQEPQGPARP